MPDPSDMELLDHLAGHGSDEQRRRVQGLLDASPALRRRYDELAAVWRLLGRADASLPPRDLWPEIAEKLRREQASPAGGFSWRLGWWAKAAAAVILAVSAGHVAGRYYAGARDGGAKPSAVAAADVAQDLRLDAFGSAPVLSFAENVLSGSTDGERNDR